MEYEVKKLTDNIWTIDEFGVRSFIVVGRDKALVIDTGMNGVDFISEIRKITDLPVMLVNTHSDVDHVGANSAFAGLPSYAHRDEVKYLASDEHPYLPVEDGYVFDLGGVKLEVVATPGHTPGHICLFDRERGILFTGDTASEVPIWMFGDDKRNLEAFKSSLKKLMGMDGIKELFPCHGNIPIKPEGLFEDILALAESVERGDSEWVEAEPMEGVKVKLHKLGRAQIFTF